MFFGGYYNFLALFYAQHWVCIFVCYLNLGIFICQLIQDTKFSTTVLFLLIYTAAFANIFIVMQGPN